MSFLVVYLQLLPEIFLKTYDFILPAFVLILLFKNKIGFKFIPIYLLYFLTFAVFLLLKDDFRSELGVYINYFLAGLRPLLIFTIIFSFIDLNVDKRHLINLIVFSQFLMLAINVIALNDQVIYRAISLIYNPSTFFETKYTDFDNVASLAAISGRASSIFGAVYTAGLYHGLTLIAMCITFRRNLIFLLLFILNSINGLLSGSSVFFLSIPIGGAIIFYNFFESKFIALYLSIILGSLFLFLFGDIFIQQSFSRYAPGSHVGETLRSLDSIDWVIGTKGFSYYRETDSGLMSKVLFGGVIFFVITISAYIQGFRVLFQKIYHHNQSYVVMVLALSLCLFAELGLTGFSQPRASMLGFLAFYTFSDNKKIN